MNVYYFSHLLLAGPIKGMFWCFFLLAFCFIGIHALKLTALGWNQTRAAKSPPQEANGKSEKENPEKKAPEKANPQEPIYYIVERKQRRSKPNYGEPKEIRFK